VLQLDFAILMSYSDHFGIDDIQKSARHLKAGVIYWIESHKAQLKNYEKG